MSGPQVRVPFDLLDQYLDVIVGQSLNVEIYLSGESLDRFPPDGPETILAKLTHDPRITIHAPFMDLNPGAVDLRVLEATRERFRQAFDVAEVLKPARIVFHSGYEKWKYDHDVALWLERSLSFWPEFIARAEAIDTRIAVENIFEDEPSGLVRLMEELKSERVGICFDAGHCNIFTSVPVRKWLDDLGPYIIETHLHDNNGDFDSHLAIGEGSIDFREIISALEGRDVVDAPVVHTPVVHTIEALDPESTFKSIIALEGLLSSEAG